MCQTIIISILLVTGISSVHKMYILIYFDTPQKRQNPKKGKNQQIRKNLKKQNRNIYRYIFYVYFFWYWSKWNFKLPFWYSWQTWLRELSEISVPDLLLCQELQQKRYNVSIIVISFLGSDRWYVKIILGKHSINPSFVYFKNYIYPQWWSHCHFDIHSVKYPYL